MPRLPGFPAILCLLLLLVGLGGTGLAGENQCTCPCPCPSEAAEEPAADSDACPETVVLNSIEEVYEAVEFSHRSHAEMADGCATCHHHTPPGQYKKCGTCHIKTLFEPDKLNMPNLKAAYHRQCIECHVEYDAGPVDCLECHAIREDLASGKE